MYEISITWWKPAGEPDPDKTAWWTEPIKECPRLTPKKVFEETIGAYKGWVESNDENGKPKHKAAYRFERAEDPPPDPFVEGVDEPFPEPLNDGTIAPAMRLRYVADADEGCAFHGIRSVCLKRLGFTNFGMVDEYEDFVFKAARLMEAFVYEARTYPDVKQAMASLILPDGRRVSVSSMDHCKSLLADYLPEYFLRRAVGLGR